MLPCIPVTQSASSLADFLRRFNAGVYGGNDADEVPLSRFQVSADDLEDSRAVLLTGKRNIEISCLQLEKLREQIRVIHVRAVGSSEIAPRAGMNPDTLALFR